MSMVLPPAAVSNDGTRRVVWVDATADPDAITLTEATAGENLSLYLTGDGWNATGEQAVIADERLGASTTYESPGRKTKGLSVRYVFNLGTPADDVARLTLNEGEAGYLVHFLQKEEGEAFAVGDWYEAWPVRMGEQMIVAKESNAVDRIDQRTYVTGPVSKFKQLVAA